jgi:hypothetical protein
MGGLGNQMFQVANCYAQAKKNNVEMFLPKNSFTPLQGKDTSHYIDNILKKFKFKDNITNFFRLNENSWSFTEIDTPKNCNIQFYGYYQSSKNFSEYKKEIIDLFSPSQYEIDFISKKYPEINLKNTLSVHIRMGDYLKNPKIHPTISLEYINKSINLIGEYEHIFIFSDNKKWVENNINLPNSTIVDDLDYIELWLMSLCTNNIISNSTFSWWGSFLNKNENKIVIAPSVWFGEDGPKNYLDIYESDWTIMNVNNHNGQLC